MSGAPPTLRPWPRLLVTLLATVALVACSSAPAASGTPAVTSRSPAAPATSTNASPSTGVDLAPASARPAAPGSSPSTAVDPRVQAAIDACTGNATFVATDDPARLDRPVAMLDAKGNRLCLGPALVYGPIVERADAATDPNGRPVVKLVLTGQGIDLFNLAAARCYAEKPDVTICPTGRLALLVKQRILVDPTINAAHYEADRIQVGLVDNGPRSEAVAADLRENPLVLRPVVADLGTGS